MTTTNNDSLKSRLDTLFEEIAAKYPEHREELFRVALDATFLELLEIADKSWHPEKKAS